MIKKNITIKQIACDAGVSIATVSRVFNGKDFEKVGKDARKRVMDIIKKYNYTPSVHAKGLVSGQSSLIGVQLLSLKSPLSNIDLIEAIEVQAAAHGYSIILGVSDWNHEREAKSLNVMLEKGCDGIIWQPVGKPQQEFLEKILVKKSPLVWLNKDGGHGQPGAFNDEVISGCLAAKYLFEKGCRKPVFVGNLKDLHSQKRLTGWNRKLRLHNIPCGREIDVSGFMIDSVQKGCKLMSELLDVSQADGAFLSGSYIALGSYLALSSKGLTINDFPLIGHNLISDIPALIPLPSICPRYKQIGSAAFDILIKIINQQKVKNFYCEPIVNENFYLEKLMKKNCLQIFKNE